MRADRAGVPDVSPPGQPCGPARGRHGDQSWMRRTWPCPAPKPNPLFET